MLRDICRCARCEGLEDGLPEPERRSAPRLAYTPPVRRTTCYCCGQPLLEDGTCACGWTPETLSGPHLLGCAAALPF
jgi:hypothetical protein